MNKHNYCSKLRIQNEILHKMFIIPWSGVLFSSTFFSNFGNLTLKSFKVTLALKNNNETKNILYFIINYLHVLLQKQLYINTILYRIMYI